jgi:uncharacterized protein YjbJ (UPF0337 family)
MDENRIEGSVRNAGGKVQEGLGHAMGGSKTQAEGIANQAVGAAQDFYGQAKDAATDSMTSLDSWLRNTIETQPYTTAIVALSVGWLLGRLRRPY